MTAMSTELTVGQLVRQRPARSRVFEALKIDYCCGGKLSLAEACQRKGVDTAEVWKRLAECDAQSDRQAGDADDQPVDADAMTLSALAQHIEQTHHAYLKTELPRLDRMTEKVARVHGDRDPRLPDLRRAFEALRDELLPHMMKEEMILFPMVRKLEQQLQSAAALSAPPFHCGSVADPIGQMEHEHDKAGSALQSMRELTDGFQPPDWACNTYRAMLDGLAVLERDMHQHVHKENNVMFPKAIELETAMMAKQAARCSTI
ncbi:MAG: iron-sulfur cluster repair di-iron protein [Pirellulaceae bacterium]|nr:iron-sulfur cluster repair di-iron protein [Pirellulaceae bacterium]